MKAWSLCLQPSFLASWLSYRVSSLTFANQSATSFATIAFVSSSVISHGSFIGSGFFFAGRFRFFFGGCTDLKDCAQDLCGACSAVDCC
jgi:hypothetical protein